MNDRLFELDPIAPACPVCAGDHPEHDCPHGRAPRLDLSAKPTTDHEHHHPDGRITRHCHQHGDTPHTHMGHDYWTTYHRI